VDFVVCNHVLEHMRDPLGAMRAWLRVLRPGGHLYVSIPDGQNPLDRHRALTPFDHLLADAAGSRADADRAHYADWTQSVHRQLSPEDRLSLAAELEQRGYSVHFHVFGRKLFERVLSHACRETDAEVIEFQENSLPDLKEYVAVLRRSGPLVAERPVDVIVPVYNAREYTRRCVESVVQHATGDWRLLLVDDASTEPGLREDLRAFAAMHPRVVLLENEKNLGFVATANRGMRQAGGRDVLLLNSDTEVFEGFLDRMRAAVDADPSTGIVTPFSNNATICSIPRFPEDNAVPEGYTPPEFARLVAACSRRSRPELPTGVGFCMWVRAEVLSRVGLFDEETFGRGYGEENDLCQRARKAGYKVRLCDDVFVYHKGKASFGDDGKTLEQTTSAQRLEAKHPGYHAEIARFIQENPLAPLHRTVQFHIPRLRPGRESAILFLLHASPWASRPGGTEYHVRDLLRALAMPRAVVAWPQGPDVMAAEVLDGDVDRPLRYAFRAGSNFGLEAALRIGLRRAIQTLGVHAAHVHHLMNWPFDVTAVLEDAEVPFVWTHHDYFAVCLNWNLFDHDRGEPCGCAPGSERSTCLARYAQATGALAGKDVAEVGRLHRSGMDRALAAACAHVFPSHAARATFERSLGTSGPRRIVVEHGYDASNAAERAPRGARLRVAFMGEIAYPIKGAERYLQLLERARDLAIEWHIFGDTEPFGFSKRLAGVELADRIVSHGRYDRHTLPDLLRSFGIDVGVILPNWDETFSYVLSECLVAGVPVIVSNRGALAERVTRTGAGCVVSTVEEAFQELRMVSESRDRLDAWAARARAQPHRPVSASAEEHRALYSTLGWLKRTSLSLSDTRLLPGLEAVSEDRQSMPFVHAGGSELFAVARKYLRRVVPAPVRRIGSGLLRHMRDRPWREVALPSHGDEQWRDVSVLERSRSGAVLELRSADPQVMLDVSPFDPRHVRSVRFRVRHELPGGAFAQLYWTHDDAEQFSETKSVQVALGPPDSAWRMVECRLDTPAVRPNWLAGTRITRLRFDPAATAGRMELGNFTLHR
jgi:GT2 family glycosyltransferase/glycosyltransferase involved in cell wall biosynthesis